LLTWSWCYDRYLPEADADIQASYREAQEEARHSHLGLRSEPDPIWPERKTF
jgi:endonuclease YncB( thermonuclease family)